MLTRSGFFVKPRPLVEFDCGSQSTSNVLTSAAASEAARLMAVVVLPTPPFWLATAITRPMIYFLCLAGQNMRMPLRNQCQILVQISRTFHVKHIVNCAGFWEWDDCKLEKCFTWNTIADIVS